MAADLPISVDCFSVAFPDQVDGLCQTTVCSCKGINVQLRRMIGCERTFDM